MRPATPHTTLWIPDTMTTRSAALITIALLAVLLAFVALAALFSPDISERAGGIVSTVLGSFATVLAGLLLFLRVETLNSKADDARTHAAAAAKVGEEIRHDIHNDVLTSKIRQAIREIEEDPDIHERRIDRIAEGVQKDRHNLKNRKAAERMRGQLESRGMPKRDNEGA